MKTIEAVLWDNDGVLVDTEALFFEANKKTLQELGITLELESFAEINLKQGRSVLRHHCESIGKTADEITALHRARDQSYTELLKGGVAVLPGVEEALSSLKPHLRQAIVTSSLPEHFHLIHEQTGLKPNFELILTRDCYQLAKPNPEPYLTAAQQLGVAPQNCIVIEDTERGLDAAVRAGMRCILIPNALMNDGEYPSAFAIASSAKEAAALILESDFS